jgi:TolB-like protein/Flp pilus assembly protein TadD
MATVFLAQDLKHARQVALKVLHPELAATLGPDRFLREIQIAAGLQHPHILPLYDSGSADGLLYYVMPFVEGESLRDKLRLNPQMPVDEAVRISRDVASALDYAHRHGVVHRDIKPENVMLHEGEAIVTDFGIAKAVSAAGTDSLTQTGMAVGTPTYMSPEQAMGEGEPDGRSDVYSLGCMLFEMLTGNPPFAGSTAQATITKRLTDPIPSVRATRSGVSGELDQVVTKSLARDPADRFDTASQVMQALAGPTVVTPSSPTPHARPPANSIAVLPFANMSADADNEYFADGIAEEIINALSKIDALRVTSRLASFTFKGKGEDLAQIGTKLQVATVLDGSVRKFGNRLRVTAQLVNVADGLQLWSERWDRQLEDIFAIQDEIAGNIVKALKVMLTPQEKKAIEKAPTDNVEAYDFYLRGRQLFHQWRKRAIEHARRMFERAIEIDPGFALAYTGAADCSSYLYMFWDPSKAISDGADNYTRKALELDPELAEAHVSRGLVSAATKRFEEARIAFEKAIELNPKLFEARYLYGRALLQEGKPVEAVASFQEACRLRPDDFQAAAFLAQAYRSTGREFEARRFEIRAIEVIEHHLELNPEDSRALSLGSNMLVVAGGPSVREKAMAWAERALAVDPEDSHMLYNAACLYSTLGETEDALSCLAKAIDTGFGIRGWIENDPDLAPLREDDRFKALLQKL